MKIGKSLIPIADMRLTPVVWNNISGERHWFESYLEEVYPGGSDVLAANPLKIVAPHGERSFLPHSYYKHFTASGRPIVEGSGRWELYEAAIHSGSLRTFLRRYFSS